LHLANLAGHKHVHLRDCLSYLREDSSFGLSERSSETSTRLFRGSVGLLHENDHALHGWNGDIEEARDDRRHRLAIRSGETRDDVIDARLQRDRDSWL
jgi:hypothetical protein